jgi:hypothetical protein
MTDADDLTRASQKNKSFRYPREAEAVDAWINGYFELIGNRDLPPIQPSSFDFPWRAYPLGG